RGEPLSQRGQRSLEPTKLVVHRDADRLEQSREHCRPGARRGPKRAANSVHQIVARGDWTSLATPHDLARKALRARLVGVVPENVCERAFVVLLQQRGGIGSALVSFHAHVERGSLAKREAARKVVQLVG